MDAKARKYLIDLAEIAKKAKAICDDMQHDFPNSHIVISASSVFTDITMYTNRGDDGSFKTYEHEYSPFGVIEREDNFDAKE